MPVADGTIPDPAGFPSQDAAGLQRRVTSELGPVTLREITSGNLHAVLELTVADHQLRAYPRSNAYSIAEAHYPVDDDPVWLRAIYASETPVGFMMASEAPDKGEYFLWRLMIDHRFQRSGYGSRAVQLLIERILQTGNPKVLITSHLPEDANAGRFYERLGFRYTGKLIGADEPELRLTF